MAISGSCLCGEVRFEISEAVGPMEICHCTRCRKTSGAGALAAVGVRTRDYRLLSGATLIRSYAAPILYAPPAYVTYFCSSCGSPVPPAQPEGEFFEIPAGLLDDDPGIRPDKHIFVEFVPSWDTISDSLPRYSLPELIRERTGRDVPAGFRIRTHYDTPRQSS